MLVELRTRSAAKLVRLVGQRRASTKGQRKVDGVVGQVFDAGRAHADGRGPSTGADRRDARHRDAATSDEVEMPTATSMTSSTGRRAPPPRRLRPSTQAATLAIPDYDSLSASQVVPRLAGLTADELEAVRALRGRRTAAARRSSAEIAQLQQSA